MLHNFLCLISFIWNLVKTWKKAETMYYVENQIEFCTCVSKGSKMSKQSVFMYNLDNFSILIIAAPDMLWQPWNIHFK